MTHPLPAGTPAPPDPRRWKALALLCTAFFMVLLDSSIVLVALPSIDAELGFPAEDLQWVMTAYMLSFGGLLLLGGRAADLLGRRRMFLVGVGLFAISSLAAGLAASAVTLVVARVAQGVAGAVMTPCALSLLMTAFPEGAERNKALGVWTSIGAIGGTAGWLLGGPITSLLGWEWIFLINVPVALGVAALSPLLLRESRGALAQRRFDLAGAVTVTSALVLLVYAVAEAPAVGWGEVRTLGLLALAAVLIAAFVAVEARSAAPLVPLRVFRSRALVGGDLTLFALGALAYGSPFLLTRYAQEVLGWSPSQFGVAFLVMPVMAAVGSAVGQGLTTRAGTRPVALAGMALSGLSALAFTGVSVGGDYLGDLFVGLLLLGPGVGLAYVAGSIASLTGVGEAEAGLASGLSNASFQIGSAVGVAIVSTVALSSADGATALAAIVDGARSAFAVAILFAVLGAAAAACLIPRRLRDGATGSEADAEASAA